MINEQEEIESRIQQEGRQELEELGIIIPENGKI
jgi:hypothetical protein